MIFLPGWDTALSEGIKKYGNQNVYSSTLIEPKGDNENFVIKNYGYDILNFEYDRLIKELPDLRKFGYYKKHIVPYLIPTNLYEGMDERMWPGWVTDDDIAVSVFSQEPDVKFIRVSHSLLYHFMCKSTHRIGSGYQRYMMGENAKTIFNNKWGGVYPGMNSDNYREFIYSDFEGIYSTPFIIEYCFSVLTHHISLITTSNSMCALAHKMI